MCQCFAVLVTCSLVLTVGERALPPVSYSLKFCVHLGEFVEWHNHREEKHPTQKLHILCEKAEGGL